MLVIEIHALIQIIFNLFLTFAPLSQVAPNCEEDVGQVEEGGGWRSFNEEFKHKRKKTSSTSCQWSESRHGEQVKLLTSWSQRLLTALLLCRLVV